MFLHRRFSPVPEVNVRSNLVDIRASFSGAMWSPIPLLGTTFPFPRQVPFLKHKE